MQRASPLSALRFALQRHPKQWILPGLSSCWAQLGFWDFYSFSVCTTCIHHSIPLLDPGACIMLKRKIKPSWNSCKCIISDLCWLSIPPLSSLSLVLGQLSQPKHIAKPSSLSSLFLPLPPPSLQDIIKPPVSYILLFMILFICERERAHREKQTPRWSENPIWGSIPGPQDNDLS